MSVYTCLHACMCVFLYICMCVYVCVYVKSAAVDNMGLRYV